MPQGKTCPNIEDDLIKHQAIPNLAQILKRLKGVSKSNGKENIP